MAAALLTHPLLAFQAHFFFLFNSELYVFSLDLLSKSKKKNKRKETAAKATFPSKACSICDKRICVVIDMKFSLRWSDPLQTEW